jgi:TRAP-type mannitol/chloroaromatic compound transport system substrate-binding protein
MTKGRVTRREGTVDRRKFLKSAGVGTAAAGTLAAPAIAQGRQVVRMVTTWPRNFPGFGTGAQRIADRITAASGGRIEVTLFAAGELLPPLESFSAVAQGSADMYHGAEYYWVGNHPGYAFFAAVPMGFTAQELQSWVHWGGGRALWDELGEQFGVKGFLGGNTGPQMGGWFRNPITSPDDMRGLTMRMPGLGAEVLRQIGANAVNLAGGEIFPALQAGTIDATEWVSPFADEAFGFARILKNYMYPGFHEPGTGTSVGINLEWWNSLDTADQTMIEACCTAENDIMLAEFNANNGPALDRLVTNEGVQVLRFPDEVFNLFVEASEDVNAGVANHDDLGKRIYESFFEFRKFVMPWTKLAEQTYTDARATYYNL